MQKYIEISEIYTVKFKKNDLLRERKKKGKYEHSRSRFEHIDLLRERKIGKY